MESAKYFLSPIDGVFYIIYSEEIDPILRPTLNLLLSKNLFSITKETSGGVSIIYRFSDKDNIGETTKGDMLFYKSADVYNCVQVTTANPALSESGMLSEVTGFFAKLKIPILCLSTWNCNYIYYLQEHQPKLKEACLNDIDFYLE